MARTPFVIDSNVSTFGGPYTSGTAHGRVTSPGPHTLRDDSNLDGRPMSWWEAVVLGAVQGATEFLPVSSSGHLVIGQALLNLRIPGVRFEVALHLATLVSVVAVYRSRILELLRGGLLERRREESRYLVALVVGTVPAGVAGLLFEDRFEALFDRPAVVGVALLVTGTFLISTRWALRRARSPRIGLGVALLIGVAQAFAIVPGISRSGATVVAALWLGVAPVEAAAFSFLLSIPAIAGAALLQSGELTEASAGVGSGVLLMGALVAAVVGVAAIRTFVAMLRNRSFPAFAWYCWAAGLLFLAWLGLGGY